MGAAAATGPFAAAGARGPAVAQIRTPTAAPAQASAPRVVQPITQTSLPGGLGNEVLSAADTKGRRAKAAEVATRAGYG